MTFGLLAMFASVQVTEISEPAANRIRVEIVAGIEKPDRKQWAAANVLRETLLAGTSSFTAMQLLQYATQAGEPIKVTLAADHLRIGYSVPPNDLKLAVRLADDLMRDATLVESAVKNSIEELPFRRRSAWAEAWLPLGLNLGSLSRKDVMQAYRRIFRPENVSVAIAGSFPLNQGKTAFQDRFASWVPEPSPQTRYREAEPERSPPRSTVRMEGEPIRVLPTVAVGAEAEASELGVALLACTMLGQGKGSSVFQTLREELGISYRQEAFLAPSVSGIRPVLVFASADPVSVDFRNELAQAVGAWTEGDRKRALTLMRSTVEMSLGLGILYFAEERPLTESLEDRAFLTAYWKLKTGRAWSWPSAFQEMDSVTLEKVKMYTLKWVSDSTLSQ